MPATSLAEHPPTRLADVVYVSQLLGSDVLDPDGRAVAKVTDLIVAAETDFPPVDAVVVKPANGALRSVSWASVRVLGPSSLGLAAPLERVAPHEMSERDLSLARQVLDRQIIDTNGVRVVRVNDLELARTDGQLRLVGIDVSTAGLLRRLWMGRLLSALGVRPSAPSIAWQDVEPVESGEAGVKLRVPREDLARLHPADLAQILAQLDQVHGQEVLAELDDEAAADALGEVDEALQVALIKGLDAERAADILEEMDPDEAADLLGDLEPERAQDLLSRMEADEAADVRALLAYGDEVAGGLMTPDYVAVPPEVSAEAAIGLVRQAAAELESIYEVYVTDAAGKLLGVLSLKELIGAEPGAPIGQVMQTEVVQAQVDDPQEEVARLIARYNLLALPIVDASGVLQGIVTVDDAMDVILPEQWKARVPRVYQRG